MDYSKLSDNTLKTLKEGKPLDYSKLNDDELLELKKTSPKPPTPTPVTHTANPYETEEETGKLESLLRGLEQGATFGFGDEINAGLESALTDKTYDQARQESRANFEKASTDNPLTSLLGNLAGGIAVPMPGAAGASIGRMALIGAGGGALAGLGTSEADLTKGELGKATGDVVKNALLGGALGVGVGALSKGLGAASRSWKDTESAKSLGKMFKYARADKDFNTASNLEKTSKELVGAVKDDYLPSIFKLNKGDLIEGAKNNSIEAAVSEQYELAKKLAQDKGETLNFKTFRDEIVRQLDEVKIKDPNFQKGRQEIEGFLDALGQVERTERAVPLPDVEQADDAMNALKSTVGKAKVTSDEAIRKVAKNYAQKIADGMGEGADIQQIEDDIFTHLKSKYVENFNPKYGVDIDPTTGKKFASAEYQTPQGTTKIKAKEFGDQTRMETIETIGRPELTPDVLDAATKKGQELFDTYNLGNDSTRKNYDLAKIGSDINTIASQKTMDPVQGKIAEFMRKSFGDIKARLGLDFKGLGGDDLKQAQLDAADKIKNMLVTAAKKPGSNGEIRFDEANEIAKSLSEAGYIDGSKIAQTAEKLKNLAEKEYLMRTAQGESFLSSNTQKHLLMPFSAKAKGLQIASGVGKVVGAADKAGVTKLATNTMRYITADPEIIGSLATKLERSNSSFAPVIRNLASQPEQKRRAMMFSLMQQPAFRQAINSDEEE